MSTHEQHTLTVPTSAVRNTGGRSGPQRLEKPTPDEVLRELCDKNYHQLLPLIVEKMQKEKEQQDKLNATPTAKTEPKKRHENRRSRSPTPVASVFKRLKQNRPPSPRPRPRKEGGVFNRLRGKERSASTRARRPGKLADIQIVKTVREVTGSPDQEDTSQTPTKMISLSLGHVGKETLSHLGKVPYVAGNGANESKTKPVDADKIRHDVTKDFIKSNGERIIEESPASMTPFVILEEDEALKDQSNTRIDTQFSEMKIGFKGQPSVFT
ncbi:hypothetical protein Tco_1039625 [Tanacetum coccineum]